MKQLNSRIQRATRGTLGSYVIIACITLFALILRLLYIPFALHYDPYLVQDPLFGDGRDYDAIGLNLCKGNGFADQAGEPTSRRAPVYPAFLALVYCTVGHNLLLVRISQAFMGAGLVFVVFLIARRFYGAGCALLAASIMALHPIAVYFGAFIGTESLFLLILCITFLAAISIADRPSVPRLFMLGVLQGIAALARPQVVLYWPVLPAWIFFIKRREPLRRAVAQWLVVVLVSLLTILPWTVRNYRVHKALVLIDTHGGWTLYGSYGISNHGEFVPRWDAAAKGLSEYQQDKLYYQLAFQLIGDHPLRAVQLIPEKVARLLSPIAAVDKEYPVRWAGIAKVLYAIFLVFALIGVIFSTLQWRDSFLLYANILITLFTTAIFYGCTRFSLPMQPALVIFAGLSIVRLTASLVGKIARQQPKTSVV